MRLDLAAPILMSVSLKPREQFRYTGRDRDGIPHHDRHVYGLTVRAARSDGDVDVTISTAAGAYLIDPATLTGDPAAAVHAATTAVTLLANARTTAARMAADLARLADLHLES